MPPGIAVLGDSTSIGIHLAILKKCGFPVRLLWMPSEPMLRSIATQFEIPQMATTEDAAMLAVDVGIIVIGLEPTHQHRIVSKAIGIGKHVVCLPPSDIRKEGVVEMLNSAKYYPQLIAFVAHGLRFLNIFQKMRSLIKESYVGNLYRCELRIQVPDEPVSSYSWKNDAMMGGGILNLYGAEMVGLVHYLLQDKFHMVSGYVKCFSGEFPQKNCLRVSTSDDFGLLQGETKKGTSVVIMLNRNSLKFDLDVKVIGSLGSLRATNEFLYGQKNNSQQQEELILQESLSDAEELVQYSPERVPTSLYVQGLMNFFQQLRESFKDSGVGSPTSSWSKDSMTDAVSFDDYHQIQSILAAFRLSHRHRRWFGVETNLIETEDVKFI